MYCRGHLSTWQRENVCPGRRGKGFSFWRFFSVMSLKRQNSKKAILVHLMQDRLLTRTLNTWSRDCTINGRLTGRHTIYRKNRFIAILVYTLLFVRILVGMLNLSFCRLYLYIYYSFIYLFYFTCLISSFSR